MFQVCKGRTALQWTSADLPPPSRAGISRTRGLPAMCASLQSVPTPSLDPECPPRPFSCFSFFFYFICCIDLLNFFVKFFLWKIGTAVRTFLWKIGTAVHTYHSAFSFLQYFKENLSHRIIFTHKNMCLISMVFFVRLFVF